MADLGGWFAAYAAAEQRPERVETWVRRTMRAVLAAVPEVDEDLGALIVEAIRQQWVAFLARLSDGRPFEFVPGAREFAEELARRRIGLPLLLAAYGAARRASWEYATEVVREAPPELDHEELLVRLWSGAGEWFEAAIHESVVVHQREARRLERRGDAQRLDLVTELLARADVDPAAASAALDGYPVGGSHLALIARAEVPDAIGVLESAVRRVTAEFRGARPLVVRPGGRELWCWVPADKVPRLDVSGMDPAQVRVTIGGPAEGVDGFALAYDEARAAQIIALAPGRRQPVTAYADVAALVLLAREGEAAERFTRRVLGSLAAPEADRLRATVRAVLGRSGGGDAVARELAVHKNTVRYRVAQAEDALGHPIRDRAGDLLLALDYYDTFLASH